MMGVERRTFGTACPVHSYFSVNPKMSLRIEGMICLFSWDTASPWMTAVLLVLWAGYCVAVGNTTGVTAIGLAKGAVCRLLL